MDLKNKRGYAVMINSSGTNPMKYIMGMHAILGQLKKKGAEGILVCPIEKMVV